MIAVPETVRRKALVADAGQRLDELPAIVAGLERDWSMTVGRPTTTPPRHLWPMRLWTTAPRPR
jgi:hypothetical protein